MAKDLRTIWPLEPHTAAKHAILKRYLQAWIPILSSAHGRIVYIDGFAGPGVYSRGEDGSPIIALKSALEHAPRIKGEMSFLFIERDPNREANLRQSVAALSLPPSFNVNIQLGDCAETIGHLLDDLNRAGEQLAPTFAFLDPFGFSHTPIGLVKRLMMHRRCEVLITFMFEEINRFLDQEKMPANFDALFGCPAWAHARGIAPPSERKSYLRNLYQQQLQQEAGATYVRSFEMRNRGNRTDYFLFFGTKSIPGLKKMKEAMWRVDTSGAFQFSDATDPSQVLLLESGPDAGALRRRLVAEYRGREVSIDVLEEFIITETPFRETHLRRAVLVPMEKANPPEIEVVRAPVGRRRSFFPPGTVLRFLNGA